MQDVLGYLKEMVEPTISDFEAHPTSVRHAFLACVVTFHVVDYLAHPRKPSVLRQQFKIESPDFAAIDDVAHAFKHVVVGKSGLKAEQVIPRPPGTFDTFVLDLSRLDDGIGGVTLVSDIGVDILDSVRNAVAFLRTKLRRDD